jgi:PAS domain S-box-containing protein
LALWVVKGGRSEVDHTRADEPRDLCALRALSETEVRAMVDASPDGMLLADELGTILFVNSQMEAMFGYEPGDLPGRAVEVLVPEQYQQVHTAHRTRYRAEPKTRAMGTGLELIARCRDGSEFPVEISLSPIRTEDGLRVVATVRDITARLAIDGHTHAVFHTIDAAHDGVFMFDPDTLRFTYVNDGAEQQLGYDGEELLTMTPLHIKPEFTEQTFRDMLEPLLADRVDSHAFTTIHRRKDGTDVPVEIVMNYPPAEQPGHPRLVVALVRDITKRLRNERAARTQQVRIKLLEDRERLARDLHDVVIQRLFAAGMGLQGVQALATDATLDERITDTVQQLDQTITELRSAIFHLTTSPSVVDAQLRERIEDAAISLGHEPSLQIVGDVESIAPDVLEHLLSTLNEALSNIARHAQATATDVAVNIGTESVVLTVTDNGIGIDPAAPRGDGLSNLEARAEQLGGVASIASSADQGTTVTWTAPRA